MDDYNNLRSHDIMTASIFSFLENLLAAVRTSETLASEAQERDQINISNDIKPGGYSEDIFIFLSEREKEEYTCCVCYFMIKDVHQCSNGHKFCYSCIYVWSTCNRIGADCCPACRCEGIYARNEQLNDKICSKRVKCQDEGCNWRGFLRDYSEHEHRHYEFKELSRSIDLPNISASETVKVITPPPPFLPPESAEINKTATVETQNAIQSESSLSPVVVATNNAPNHSTVRGNSSRTVVSRSNLAPRRLSRLPDTVPSNVVRTVGPRSIVNNHQRQDHTQTNSRCLNHFQPRPPPRGPRHNRSSEPSASESLTRLNHHESTQTYEEESRTETTVPVARLASASSRDSHSPLFPPIHAATNHRPTMEYRRLAPTYASRRQNLGLLSDGQEHFTRMLLLLTADLEERTPSTRTLPRSHMTLPHARSGAGLTVAPSATSSTNTINNRNTSRLLEFRDLNRRLTEVASSLDLLIESTSRHGGDGTTAATDSSMSTTDSDAEEEDCTRDSL